MSDSQAKKQLLTREERDLIAKDNADVCYAQVEHFCRGGDEQDDVTTPKQKKVTHVALETEQAMVLPETYGKGALANELAKSSLFLPTQVFSRLEVSRLEKNAEHDIREIYASKHRDIVIKAKSPPLDSHHQDLLLAVLSLSIAGERTIITSAPDLYRALGGRGRCSGQQTKRFIERFNDMQNCELSVKHTDKSRFECNDSFDDRLLRFEYRADEEGSSRNLFFICFPRRFTTLWKHVTLVNMLKRQGLSAFARLLQTYTSAHSEKIEKGKKIANKRELKKLPLRVAKTTSSHRKFKMRLKLALAELKAAGELLEGGQILFGGRMKASFFQRGNNDDVLCYRRVTNISDTC